MEHGGDLGGCQDAHLHSEINIYLNGKPRMQYNQNDVKTIIVMAKDKYDITILTASIN